MTKELKICVKKALGEVVKFICTCFCVCLVLTGCWLGIISGLYHKEISDCMSDGTSVEICQEVANID